MDALPKEILGKIGEYLDLHSLVNVMVSCRAGLGIGENKLHLNKILKSYSHLVCLEFVPKYFPNVFFVQINLTTRTAGSLVYVPATPFQVMVCIEDLSDIMQNAIADCFERIDRLYVSCGIRYLSTYLLQCYPSAYLEFCLDIHDNSDLHIFETLDFGRNLRQLQLYYYSRGGILNLLGLANAHITVHNPMFDEIHFDQPIAGVYLVEDEYVAPLPAINIYAKATCQFIPTEITKNIWLYDYNFDDPIRVCYNLKQFQRFLVHFVATTETQAQIARVYGTLFPHIGLWTSVSYNPDVKFITDVPGTMLFNHLPPISLRHMTPRFVNALELLYQDVPGYKDLDQYLRDLWADKKRLRM